MTRVIGKFSVENNDRGYNAVPMKKKFAVFATVLASLAAAAQQPTLASPLLDHLAGHWVLRGTIAGKPTTHDVDAEWVIQHQYLRLHEVSQEQNAKRQPQYEAMIFKAGTRPQDLHLRMARRLRRSFHRFPRHR